jgi:uncharacterized surface protein with fasciclin (FAS1) repeats
MKLFLTFKKYTLLVAVVFFASIAMISCDDDDEGGPVTFDGTIAELINDPLYKQASNGDPLKSFDSLYKYLTIYPDLVAVASGTTPITLFAPNNTAFVNLLATPGFPANIADINPAVIKGVLSYHVVVDELRKAELVPTGTGAGISTAFAQPDNCNPTAAGVVQVIKVNADGTLLTGSTNVAIDITTPDLVASNGVVHIVESVMIPPSVGSSLTPILGKLSGTVLLGSDFTYLAALITYADCGFTGAATSKLAAILSGPGPYTAFLPANVYFTSPVTSGGLGYTSPTQAIAALGGTPDAVRAVILNHVILTGSFTGTQLASGGNKQSAGAANLNFFGGVFPPGSTNQTIYVRDNDCASNKAAAVVVANIPHSNGNGHAVWGAITDCPSNASN